MIEKSYGTSLVRNSSAGIEEEIEYYDEPVDDFVGEVYHYSRG